ncbi:MAG: hypothetical protein HFF17_11230 [Oscillospiraceae bacterium]|nr:hypothetical protein [Oscillospiraceae bacterium]
MFLSFGSAVIGPEMFLQALSIARNLDHPTRHITTANFDLKDLGVTGDDWRGVMLRRCCEERDIRTDGRKFPGTRPAPTASPTRRRAAGPSTAVCRGTRRRNAPWPSPTRRAAASA